MKRRFLLAAAMGVLAGCGGSGGVKPVTNPVVLVEARATTDKTVYRRGEPVRVTVTFRNRSRQAQTITSASSSFLFVEVRPLAGGDPVALISNAALQVVTTRTLAPGETLSEGGIWNQKLGGVDAPRGQYVLLPSRIGGATSNIVTNVPATVQLTD